MVRNMLIPVVLGGILIVSLSLVENVFIKDRWGNPGAEAEEMGKRFSGVPKEIGDWKGEDLPVEEIVKKTAGAVNVVSRRYVYKSSNMWVRMWLVVGHSRDICRHTPNVCYPASGFRPEGLQIKHHIDLPNGDSSDFFTAKFLKDDATGRNLERVFWAWNHPQKDKWEAPDSPRIHYGLSRALYKVYFTSGVLVSENTAEDNVAAEFAGLMLPEINRALFPELAPGSAASAEETSKPESAETAPAAK